MHLNARSSLPSSGSASLHRLASALVGLSLACATGLPLVCAAACQSTPRDAEPATSGPASGQVEAQLAEARAAIQTGQVTDAITRIWGVVEANPTHLGARTLLANAYVIAGRHADALKEAEAALALDDKASDAWVAKGAALMGLDRRAEALTATKKAARYDSTSVPAFRNLSRLYREAKDLKHERSALEKWVEASPDDPTPRILLARNHAARGDFKSALRAAYEASRRAPDDADIHVFLAATHLELDDYDMAMDHSDIAHRLDSSREDAQQIFEAAFYVSAVSTLRCSKGLGPWERRDVEGVLATYLQEGVRNVEVFFAFHERFKDDPTVIKRLERADARCDKEVRNRAEGGEDNEDEPDNEDD